MCLTLQNKWERKESHLSPATTQLKAEGLQPPVWKRSHMFQAEAVGLEPTTVFDRSCFQDSVLIRPGDFRSRIAILRDPARCSDVSGNRTRGLLDENQAILPSESTTPFRWPASWLAEYRIGVSISFLLPEKQPT